jgi:hypothetical protein
MNGNYSYFPQYQQGYSQPIPDQLMQYRQMGQQMQNMPQNQLQQPVGISPESPMIWVQGEAGAKAYLVAPGCSVVLWDSEADVVYIKSANQNGMPVTRVFDYKERLSQAPQTAFPPAQDYVTRKEFEALTARLNAIAGKNNKEDEDGE